MVQFRHISRIIGLLLCTLALAMLLPAAVDLADNNPDWKVFVGSAIFTGFIGVLLSLIDVHAKATMLSLKSSFVMTTLSWITFTAFAAIPFIGVGLSYTDSYFEAMSAVTTTGSTVFTGLGKLPRGLLLWRSALQWIGGVGIVFTAIIILPILRIGGMQLFQSESSERSDKVLPRTLDTLRSLTVLYLSISVACAAGYFALGMSGFDAICHAMTTVSTGGFSTHDESIAFFRSPAIEWFAIPFMIAGALPFFALVGAMRGNWQALLRDQQIRGFLGFLLAVTLLLTFYRVTTSDIGFAVALRHVAFSVVSVVTTTGFATDDYLTWGPLAVGFFFFLTFVGGCAGSTSGAIKIYRWQLAGLITRRHATHLYSPHQVVPQYYNKRRLSDEVAMSVIAFLALYVATVGFVTLLLTMLGLDFVTSVSSAATAMGNVGPGIGDIVGPSGNFSTLPAAAKWILSFTMMLGRLEIFTVFVVLQPGFWRH